MSVAVLHPKYNLLHNIFGLNINSQLLGFLQFDLQFYLSPLSGRLELLPYQEPKEEEYEMDYYEHAYMAKEQVIENYTFIDARLEYVLTSEDQENKHYTHARVCLNEPGMNSFSWFFHSYYFLKGHIGFKANWQSFLVENKSHWQNLKYFLKSS